MLTESLIFWKAVSRHSADTFPKLPSWVSDFKAKDKDKTPNRFPNSGGSMWKMLPGRPYLKMASLYVNGCIIDKVIFKVDNQRGH